MLKVKRYARRRFLKAQRNWQRLKVEGGERCDGRPLGNSFCLLVPYMLLRNHIHFGSKFISSNKRDHHHHFIQRTCSSIRTSCYLPSNHPVGQAHVNNCHPELDGGIASHPDDPRFELLIWVESCSCWGRAASTSSIPVFWESDDDQEQMAARRTRASFSAHTLFCFRLVSR